MPLPRYFSIPSRVVGGLDFKVSALNCNPCSRSWNHRPSPVNHSPALTEGRVPTTVTRSRRPWALTRSTANPFSSLKNVMAQQAPKGFQPVWRSDSAITAILHQNIVLGKPRYPSLTGRPLLRPITNELQQFSFWLLSVNGRLGRARRSVARRLDSFRIVKKAAIGARRSDAPYPS